jgi:hypothetical protein
MEEIKKEMRLSKPENFADVVRIPEIVIYSEDNFEGFEYRTNCNADYVGKLFNGSVKSIIVVSGTWEFYKDADFKVGTQSKGGFSFVLTPGYYETLERTNFSSFKCIMP